MALNSILPSPPSFSKSQVEEGVFTGKEVGQLPQMGVFQSRDVENSKKNLNFNP